MQARTVSALFVLVLAGTTASSASAQSATAEVSGGPAWVNSLGVHNSAWHVGGSGEIRAGAVGLGAGLDFIYLPRARRTYPRGGAESPAIGIAAVTINGVYHFREREMHERRTQPFMTVGMTFMVEREALPMFSVAGGIDWWATRRAGLRVEVRNQFVGVPTTPVMLGVRVGMVLR